MKTLIALLCLIAQTSFAGGLFGPSTYEECIDEYIPKTKTVFATRLVKWSCSNEFRSNRTDSEYMAYYQCIRDNVSGALNEGSARLIAYRCKDKAGIRGE